MVKHFHLDMGGAARFLMLLTSATTPPLLRLRCPALLRLSRRRSSLVPCLYHSLSPPSPPRLSKIKASSQFHSQTASTPFFDSTSSSSAVLVSQTWPEWSHFIDYLSNAGYFNSQGSRLNLNEEFVAGLDLPDHFVNASYACLAFASQRPDLLGMLSRSDIEVVVENGMPFLFTNGEDSVRKMRSFLGTAHGNNTDRAQTIDLVRFLLSYASNPVSSGNNRELVESSVRNLINQLVQLTYDPEASLSGSLQNQYPERYGQTPTSPGAPLSNTSPAPRPSGQNIEMRRGDWVCPRCSFMNFARNMKCLECQEARPQPSGQNIEMKRGDWVCPRCSLMNFARNMKCLECQEARPKRQLTGGEWECPQCDFFNYGRNTVCLRCDCRRPGEVSFGANNSTPDLGYNASVDSRLAANEEKAQRWFSKISQLDSNSDMNSAIEDEDFPEIMPLRKGVNRFVVSTRKSPLDRRLANSQHLSNSGDASEKSTQNLNPSQSLDPNSSNQREEEQDEKSERWFKRVAELHNVTDPANEIPDEDFPEIMPMRKGENRFVVSKRKDRSLTSPVYKRRTATEQASNSNFVPFVPFPPDYFARKDNQEPPNGSSNNTASGPSNSGSSLTGPTQQMENQSSTTGNVGSRTWEKNRNTESYSMQNVSDSQPSSSRNEHSGRNSFIGAQNSHETLSETPSKGNDWSNGLSIRSENENVRGSWSEKSLEGSAVKEPDPLDMSEEAKAERWFRRVAQIKDISELSEIPDEDFPSIMPMRKGVNRFVVSKRKTPLERRLTSTQYRRNLPVMNSDPLKENDSN